MSEKNRNDVLTHNLVEKELSENLSARNLLFDECMNSELASKFRKFGQSSKAVCSKLADKLAPEQTEIKKAQEKSPCLPEFNLDKDFKIERPLPSPRIAPLDLNAPENQVQPKV